MKQGYEEDLLLKPKLSKQIPNVLENEHPAPQLEREGKKLSKKARKKVEYLQFGSIFAEYILPRNIKLILGSAKCIWF